MNYKQCAKTLLTHENILIITHKNPDGDTVGSAAALCSAIQRAGRTAYLYPNPQITGKLYSFAGKFFAPEDFQPQYILTVDIAEEKLYAKGFEGKADFAVDHHPTNAHFAAEELIRADKASCAEIAAEIILCLHEDMTAEEATLLYIGLSTDTGCFQYSNTNAAAFRAASELLKYGADNTLVNTLFFRKVSPARLKLESLLYAGMRYYRDGAIAVATVTLDMLEKAGASEDDCDDLAGLAGRAEGSIVNVTIREQADGSSKVSVRTTKDVSSSDICAVFGGGGHAMAAGCTIYKNPDKARELLLNVIDEVWK